MSLEFGTNRIWELNFNGTDLTELAINDVTVWKNPLTYNVIEDDTYSVEATKTLEEDELPSAFKIPSEFNKQAVTKISANAFSYLPLTEITLQDNIKTIDNYAFTNCSNLSSIVIPDSVTSIGDGVFQNCTSLSSIEIGDSVTSISEGAFYNCNKLKSVVIGDSVTAISRAAFRACGSLNSVKIPEGATSIDDWAFGECYALTAIEIPISIQTIGQSVFSDAFALDTVKYPGTLTDWANVEKDSSGLDLSYAFIELNDGVYIPAGSYEFKRVLTTPTKSWTAETVSTWEEKLNFGYNGTIRDTMRYDRGTNDLCFWYQNGGNIAYGYSSDKWYLSKKIEITEDTIVSKNFAEWFSENLCCRKGRIQFTVDNKECFAKEGMTWGEWLNSVFNIDNFTKKSGPGGKYFVTDSTSTTLKESSGSAVYTTDTIIAEGTYYF